MNFCHITAIGHITEANHVSAMALRWQSQMIWISIYSPHSSHMKDRLFLPKKVLLHTW